jgi:hypothetical protein
MAIKQTIDTETSGSRITLPGLSRWPESSSNANGRGNQIEGMIETFLRVFTGPIMSGAFDEILELLRM